MSNHPGFYHTLKVYGVDKGRKGYFTGIRYELGWTNCGIGICIKACEVLERRTHERHGDHHAEEDLDDFLGSPGTLW